MSRFQPDPQIQQLRAARAGIVALRQPAEVIEQTIGVGQAGVISPFGNKPIMPVSVPSVMALAGTPSSAPTVGHSFATTKSVNNSASISLVPSNSLEALAGTPSETPVVVVAPTTSVI